MGNEKPALYLNFDISTSLLIHIKKSTLLLNNMGEFSKIEGNSPIPMSRKDTVSADDTWFAFFMFFTLIFPDKLLSILEKCVHNESYRGDFLHLSLLTHFVVHYFVSFLVLQSSWRRRESWLLCFYCLTDVFYCKCSVTLPQGAVGLSAVCDCGISWSYSLTF